MCDYLKRGVFRPIEEVFTDPVHGNKPDIDLILRRLFISTDGCSIRECV